MNLHVLVDERIAHSLNCQDTAYQRNEHFGTPDQRARGNARDILDARAHAVRYIWSGHSSYSEGGCPNPSLPAFALSGFNLRNMEKYDFSPFGDVNLGGRDLLVTLGPLWNCPAILAARGTKPGPCYNATEIVGGGMRATRCPSSIPASSRTGSRRRTATSLRRTPSPGCSG